MKKNALAAIGWGLLGATVLTACPPKELRVRVSEEGVGYVLQSCGSVPGECALDAGARPQSGSTIAFKLVVVTDDEPRAVRAESACIQLKFDCDFESEQAAYCLQVQINERLDEEMRDGISFDGLEPSQTHLIMAMFNAADGAPTDCVPQHLFGCAGLAESDDVYDIACAGCVDGPRADTDRFDLDAAVCFGECFVNECYTVLGGS